MHLEKSKIRPLDSIPFTDLTDRYQIQGLLGKQTGRRTFLATDTATGNTVVVKLILFGPDFSWDDLKLFEREAETLKSLDHPAIPKYLDSFEVDTPLGQGFALVQTYIKARSLQEWVTGGYTFSESDLRGIATGLLSILEYLHQRQPPVIHRDIKPSNILLPDSDSHTKEGVYLVDFGSVQTTQNSGTITIVGTYGYMPPEQFGGRALPASDIYSLGATLIYLATGKHPSELMQADMQIVFDTTHLSQHLSVCLRQLTYADLARRTSSASEALQKLTNPEKSGIFRKSSTKIDSHQNPSAILKSTFVDFSVNESSKELVIQFSEARIIRESKLSKYKITNSQLHPITGAAIALIITITGHVGQSIQPGSTDEFYLVLKALTACFVTIPSLEIYLRARHKPSKPCQLKLSCDINNSVSINLARVHRKSDTGWITKHSKEITTTLISNAKLQLISTTSGFFRDRMVLWFYNHKGKRRKLEVQGKCKEISWLCEHIERWGKCEIQNRLR